MAAVLQWQEDPSTRSLRRVRGLGGRALCRWLVLRSLRAVPEVWRLPVWAQADGVNAQCVSHFLGRGHFKREFHKELIRNFMEPCVGSWSLLIKSGRRPRSGRSWRCRSRRPCATAMSSLRTIVRPTRCGTWIGRNCSCISRHSCCKTLQDRDVCTLLLTKPILGLPDWIRSGYRGVGDIRPACLFPLVISKYSGVRRCCKVGQFVREEVCLFDSSQDGLAQRCSGNPNGSTPGGPGCEFFYISQLRFELDRLFQELDTPPSRGCAMSCVSLITADIDQAFEACSSSAVLPAWRRIPQTYESRFSSNSILVRRGRRELCKPGRSHSFGSGWLSFATPVLARALFSFKSMSLVMLGSMVRQIRGIPIAGVMSSAAVAVVLGAAELG